MNASQISAEIISGKLSNDELNEIVRAIKFARSRLTSQAKNTIVPGSSVKWAGRHGQMTGTVRKVAIKYATVDTAIGGWKVPLNMLQLA